MQPMTNMYRAPPSSQEIEELPRETTFEEDCATEDIPKNEEINDFLYLTWKRSIVTFLEIEHKHQETERVFYHYFRFTGVEESTS
jgi:hypothetical protein